MNKNNLTKNNSNSEEINLSIENITDEIIPQENKLDVNVLSFIGIEPITKYNDFTVSDNINEFLTKTNSKSYISSKKKKKRFFSSEKIPNNINLPNSFISKINTKRSPSTIQVNEYSITDRDLTTLKNFVKQNKEYNEIFKYSEKNKFDDYYYINEDNIETNVKIHKSNIFKKLKK